MRQAVQLARAAQQTLPSAGAQARRLVLSLFFKAVLGIERIFHFESLKDAGLALLTGGKRVLRRDTLGGLLRAAVPREVLPVKLVAAFANRLADGIPWRWPNSWAVSRGPGSAAIKKPGKASIFY